MNQILDFQDAIDRTGTAQILLIFVGQTGDNHTRAVIAESFAIDNGQEHPS